MTLSREPLEATPRLSMSPARRARILAMYGHVCAVEGCGETQGLELDHVIPLELGGQDADFNIEPRCTSCHKVKTARDRKAIAKAARLRRQADPETRRRSPRPLRSRGFGKDPLRAP